ncbi:MAG: BrnT family toxin, partial [Hydrococcus sp. RM1_1_31]|nr:BrnT family toxin [Hydrococcus sp. RM1_1_31]
DLADGITALSDPQAITIEDFNEGKFFSVTLGMSAIAQLLVVVHESTHEGIEILAARLATEREQSSYQSVQENRLNL